MEKLKPKRRLTGSRVLELYSEEVPELHAIVALGGCDKYMIVIDDPTDTESTLVSTEELLTRYEEKVSDASVALLVAEFSKDALVRSVRQRE